MRKKIESGLHYSCPVFNFKKIPAQAVAQQIYIYILCPTYRWKKHFMPPKNTDPSDSLKKLMVPPLKVISKDNPASRQRRRYNDNFATFQREHFDREMGPHQTETNLVDVLM